MSVFFIFTNFIVSGFTEVNLTITAIRGDYYYLFQATALVGLIAIITILTQGILNGKTREIKAKSGALLSSYSILLVIGITVIVTMALNIEINATVLIPLASSAFMFLSFAFIKSEFTINPISIFNKETLFIIKSLLTSSNDKCEARKLRYLVSVYEKIIARNTIEDHGGDKKSASKSLEISLSTLERKIK